VDARRRDSGESESSLQQLLDGLLRVEADDIIRDVGVVCELFERDLIAASLAANRTATSRRSCFGEDTSLRQRIMEHRAGNIAPLLSVVMRDDHDVGRNA
jgi:hypothetical protein